MNRVELGRPEAAPDISGSRLDALLRVSAALTGALEMHQVLQTAIDGAVEVLELDTGAIYLVSEDTLFLGATTPELPSDFPEEYRRAPLAEHPHIVSCLNAAETLFVKDIAFEQLTPAERGICETRGLSSVFYVPLLIDREPVGIFMVATTGTTRELSSLDAGLCRTLAQQVALAITNARLFESARAAHCELERAYDATLKGWSAALEMRDAATCGHTVRTADLTVSLARAMGAAEEALPHIYRGALLHDIGKITVPDAILNKPGPLTEDEWAVMREHPERGYRMLKDIDYLHPALDIPFCHHERWDGSGYPRGLAGDDIPFAARVFSVIDVYEALTSDRPYRAAWMHDRAIEHIREHSGTQFDSRVVESFLELIGS
jgi:HD-GYP domain-containing protein (c-di-GMP phosphodiesterase class II)